jgi:hypothetical protein
LAAVEEIKHQEGDARTLHPSLLTPDVTRSSRGARTARLWHEVRAAEPTAFAPSSPHENCSDAVRWVLNLQGFRGAGCKECSETRDWRRGSFRWAASVQSMRQLALDTTRTKSLAREAFWVHSQEKGLSLSVRP